MSGSAHGRGSGVMTAATPSTPAVPVRPVGQQTLDPLYMAMSLFRRRKFVEAVVCAK